MMVWWYQLLTVAESIKLHLSDVTGDIIILSPSVLIQNPNLKVVLVGLLSSTSNTRKLPLYSPEC